MKPISFLVGIACLLPACGAPAENPLGCDGSSLAVDVTYTDRVPIVTVEGDCTPGECSFSFGSGCPWWFTKQGGTCTVHVTVPSLGECTVQAQDPGCDYWTDIVTSDADGKLTCDTQIIHVMHGL